MNEIPFSKEHASAIAYAPFALCTMRITPDKEGGRIALPCAAETESLGIIYTGAGTHIHQTRGKGIARMETTYLEEFIHLSKTASFTKTSLALNISQPTLSRHIALLESEFGYPLIDRTTHTFKITRAGLELLNSSYEIVSLIERAKGSPSPRKRAARYRFRRVLLSRAHSALSAGIDHEGEARGSPFHGTHLRSAHH